jgi:hypothetical protein
MGSDESGWLEYISFGGIKWDERNTLAKKKLL